MKHWPLRLKLALWSALVTAVALLIFGGAAGLEIYLEDIELVDRDLKDEIREAFAELKRLGPRTNWADAKEVARALPAGWRWDRIAVARAGQNIYLSPMLHGKALGAEWSEPGLHSTALAGRPARMLIQEENGFTVRLAADMVEPLASGRELMRAYAIALPLVLLVVSFGGWWIARRALAPVEAITEAARRVNAEHLDQRLPVGRSNDEITRLTVVLNGMLDRLEASLRQAMRFSADASHELRTPLTVMRAALEDALSGGHLSAGQQEKTLLDLLDETTELSAISTKLLLLSRADAGRLGLDLRPADLSQLVREAAEEAEIIATETQISVEACVPPGVVALADGSRLLQVLRNLLENAVKYSRVGGRVRVDLLTEPEAVRVRVANSGDGITPQHAAHVFERFYRAEEHRGAHGHGLGLSIAREIARAHGGDIVLASGDAQWTVFELRLPLAPSARGAVAELAAER